VVVLDFGAFDESAQLARTAVCRGLLEVGKAAFHIVAQDGADPLGAAEVGNRVVDMSGR
jgi:hypothetical protein